MAATIPYWPLDAAYQLPPDLAAVDFRASFQPTAGAPIARPRGTGAIAQVNLPYLISDAQQATFETWFKDEIALGATRFVYRMKPMGDVRWFIFAADTTPYQFGYGDYPHIRLSCALVRYPQIPWFSDYVIAGESRTPAWVADYDGGVYGIGADKVAASALPTIAGSYYVTRITTGGTSSTNETLTAGDITSTQPVGTLTIIGYDL